MTGDYTQHQTLGEQLEAERLSLQATAPPAELPGYRMERFLGAGAFGQVWVGRDLNTGRRVAIKFYLHRGGVNWSLLAREVKHLVQLSDDRHIVQVLEVGWDADPPYYVMEYLPSGSLEDLLAARGRLPVGQAMDLLYGVCIGLNHSHGKGVLHCDLKPANILLDEDYRPRLADFGQSRMSHEQTPALGTLFYMAPEQANLDAAPDARWDVYGLGAILYRMLTGNAPHRTPELVQRIDTASTLPKRLEQYRQAILRDGPPRDHHRRRGVDRSLAQIVDGCLAVDPEKRFANVQQVLEALDRRTASLQRRPLVLLGIVGPLLLLLMTCVLMTRTVLETRATVASALREKATESNRLAAMFASRTLELELRKYFEVVEREAAADDLQDLLREVLDDDRLTELRRQIANQNNPEQAREVLLDLDVRQPLERYLRERLAQYDGGVGDSRSTDLATMFITDASGTMLAIVYDSPVPRAEDSAGRNFAFRSYFHGGREDLPPSSDPNTIEPLRETHLSPVFFSTATHLWKVAVSTPIYLDADNHSGRPDAVFVATTNLGGFELMRTEGSQSVQLNQVAVLVDARPGADRGTILQHPLMSPERAQDASIAENPPAIPPKALDALITDETVDYIDPWGEAVGDEAFRGPWLAAVQPVSLPQVARTGPQETTDLLVLVQYRWSDIIAPVGQLVTTLLWYGAVAVAGILVVIFLLWFFVRRVNDQSRPAGPAAGEKTHSGQTETIAVK